MDRQATAQVNYLMHSSAALHLYSGYLGENNKQRSCDLKNTFGKTHSKHMYNNKCTKTRMQTLEQKISNSPRRIPVFRIQTSIVR